jgi:hypothetical protein
VNFTFAWDVRQELFGMMDGDVTELGKNETVTEMSFEKTENFLFYPAIPIYHSD